jgi:WD40 repeat protein
MTQIKNFASETIKIIQVNFVEFSPSLTQLATCSNDLSILIYNLSQNEPFSKLKNAHSDYIRCVRYLDENTVITGSLDKTIKLWDIRLVNVL